MKIDDLFNHFKNELKPVVSIAATLGCHPEAVKLWAKKGELVPLRWAYMAAAKTGLPVNEEDYK